MAAAACLVLYGNSVFLAGIKADLEQASAVALDRRDERCRVFNLATVEAGNADAAALLRDSHPRAVLFDLPVSLPDFIVPLLREQPDLLLIGVDPSSDELLLMSVRPRQALSMADLIEVIQDE